MRWLGFDWGDAPLLRLRLLRAALRVGAAPDPERARPTSTTSRPTRSASTAARSTEPGRNSPWRDRPVEENLDLFERMRAGEFPDGARVLRAKIDMASGNINLRDPVLYRILHASPPAHGRRLVHLPDLRLRPRPVGRDRGHHALDLHARVRGPPAALRLVPREPAGAVAAAPVRVRAAQPEPTPCSRSASCCGWSNERPRARLGRPAHAHDLGPPPARFPGPRRSATSPSMIGVGKRDGVVEYAMLEHCVRDVLNTQRPPAHGGAAAAQGRHRRTTRRARSRSSTPTTTPRTRRRARARSRSRASSWIEREDFMEDPPKKFYRLAPGARGAPALRLLHHLPARS